MNRDTDTYCIENKPKWINMPKNENNDFNFMCSNCGMTVHEEIPPRLCPHCKKRMKTMF